MELFHPIWNLVSWAHLVDLLPCTTWDVERLVYILGSTTNLTLGRISELSTLVLCLPSLQNPYLQILHQNCVNLKPIPSMHGIFTYKFPIQINHSCIGKISRYTSAKDGIWEKNHTSFDHTFFVQAPVSSVCEWPSHLSHQVFYWRKVVTNRSAD